MDETMNFPDTWEEFVEEFGFSDSKEVYTNGTKLIPVFRVEQWLEHIRGESMHIGEKDFLQYRVHALTSQKAELKRRYESMLKEYEELQEKLEFIESGQPHPCTFDGKRHVSEYTLKDWLAKLKEEVAEVEVEVNKLGDLSAKDIVKLNNEDKDDYLEPLVEELFDVITVANSKIDWLGWTLWGRLQKQKGVNEKNRKRGYWI